MTTKFPTVAIIGAGVSGICMAIQLREQLKITSFTVFDALDEIGGTWYSNTYPGCACDVPSHLYSFSFAPKTDWSEKFSGQPEILQYLKDVVNTYKLRPYLQLSTEVRSATWDSAKNMWKLTTKKKNSTTEEEVYFNILISGVGALREPNIPEKYTTFKGPWFHSAQWDPSCKLENKNVAVVGSGASAIQIVPALAPKVKHLYVFQRTPTWIMPRNNHKYSSFTKILLKYLPFAQKIYRIALFLARELAFESFKVQKTGFPRFMSWLARKLADKHLKAQIKSPTLLNKLTPTYGMGCKRIAVADDYLVAFNRENVTLVTDHITAVEKSTICTTAGGKTEVDVLILATGFCVDKFIAPLKVIGSDRVDLLEKWSGFPEAYKGICCSGFPNMFLLLGPSTGLGHNSIIFMIECQVQFTINIIREMLEKNYAAVDVKEEPQQEFSESVQSDLKETVFTTNCSSWYENKMGKVFALWGRNCLSYWRSTRTVNMDHFYFSAR